MRDPRLAIYGGLYGLFGLSYIIYATFFAETLRVRGLALIQTGIVWALLGTLSLASGPLWGSLSDRVGRTAGLTALFALQTIAYVAFLNPASWSLMRSVLIFGVTAWGIPAIMAAAMGDVGHAEDATTAFGVVNWPGDVRCSRSGIRYVTGPFYVSTPFAGPSGTPWHKVIEAESLER